MAFNLDYRFRAPPLQILPPPGEEPMPDELLVPQAEPIPDEPPVRHAEPLLNVLPLPPAQPQPHAQPVPQLPALPEMSDLERQELITYCRRKHKEQSDSFKSMLLVATAIVAVVVAVISNNLFLAAFVSPIFYYGLDCIYKQFGNRDYIQLEQRLETVDFRQFMALYHIPPRTDFILAAFQRYKIHLKILNGQIMGRPPLQPL